MHSTHGHRTTIRIALLLASLLLHACASHPGKSILGGKPDRDGYPDHVPIDVHAVPDAVPRVEPRSRYGNPPSYVVFGKTYRVMQDGRGYVERGIASWYGTKFHGQRTSSGDPYDMYAMSAAHRSLPLPSYVRVTNLNNGRSVVVRVNDRGPFHDNRVIDLSYTAAAKLGILPAGTGLVEVRYIDPRGDTRLAAAPAPTAPAPRTAARATPEPAAGPRMFLQVGAFSERGNAERLLSRLQQAQLPNPRISNASPYRVRLGPLASVDEADRLHEQLQRIGIQDARVVID